MKKLDLLIFSFLPTVFGIVLLMVTMLWPESELLWNAGQMTMTALLLVIWWMLGKWCANQDKSPWNGFVLLQWWGIVNLGFSFFRAGAVLQSLSQMYANCMGILLFPVLGLLDASMQTPVLVLLTLSLTTTVYFIGFYMTRKRDGML